MTVADPLVSVANLCWHFNMIVIDYKKVYEIDKQETQTPQFKKNVSQNWVVFTGGLSGF